MFTPELILMILLLAQMITINIVTTGKWVKNQLNIFQKYPATDYPNFYIFNLSTEYRLLFLRVIFDLITVIITSYFLFLTLIEQSTFGIFTNWGLYTAVQLLPSLFSLMFLRLAAKKRSGLIRKKEKSFSMIPRSIFDHISLFYILLLFISALLTINILVSNEQFTLFKKSSLCLLFLLTNALLIRQIFSAIYGKSNDKLLHTNDRNKKRNQDVQRSYIGIAASIGIFALFGTAGASSTQESAWLLIPLSLFIQFSVFYRSVRWHAKNMTVYKTNNQENQTKKLG